MPVTVFVAGPGSGNGNTYFSSHPGITVRRMHPRLFMAWQDIDYLFEGVELIEYIDYGTARVTKDGIDSFHFETFQQDPCPCQLHTRPLFQR
jgi:hypothetical protein